jgi:hypothetical protein
MISSYITKYAKTLGYNKQSHTDAQTTRASALKRYVSTTKSTIYNQLTQAISL